MIGEISHEIADAIRSNHAAVLSIIGTVCGTIFGALVTFVFERIKDSGRVTFSLLEPFWSITSIGILDKERGFNGSGPGIRFQFHFLVLNSYPIPKTIFVKGVDFLPSVPRWWSKPQPLNISTDVIHVGKVFGEQEMNKDVQCEAHSFTRLWISGVGHVVNEYDGAKNVLSRSAGIQLNLIISPKKRVTIWYPLPKDALKTAVSAWQPNKPPIVR